MSTWSPTLEGFRAIFRRPSLPLAEVVWRWSFAAAASVLGIFAFWQYLDTLPVSNGDLLLLRTRHPMLVSQALAHVFHGSGLRFVLAAIVLLTAIAFLWIMVASLGRAATLEPLLTYIRQRASQFAQDDNRPASPDLKLVASGTASFPSLAGLHFLRAGLALAALGSGLASLILAGFISSKDDPHPGLVVFLASVFLLCVWMAWTTISWFLSLASIFVVREGDDAFSALASAVSLCRDRTAPIAAVGTWFGLIHLVLFFIATSVVAFPLSFASIVPLGYVLLAVLFLTLIYFAIVDTLYVARLAGYLAILEAPPAPPPPVPPVLLPDPSPDSGMLDSEVSMVDQDEPILSDTSP